MNNSLEENNKEYELDGKKVTLQEIYAQINMLKNSDKKIVEIMPKKFKTLKRLYG